MSLYQLDQKAIEVESTLVKYAEKLRRTKHVEKELQRCCLSLEGAIVKEETTKSKLQHENEALRLKIEEIRKERSVFDKIFHKQESTQYRIQKDLELLLRDSSSFVDIDGDLAVNLADLEKEAEMEKLLFETELSELDILIKNFTNRPRVQEQLLKSTSDIKLEAVKTLAQDPIDTNKQQVAPLKRKTSSNSLYLGELDEYLQYPEETVARFTQLENENFNMFGYIESINLDIVKLENEVEKLRQRLETEKIAKLASDVTRLRQIAATAEEVQLSNEKVEQQTKLYQSSCGTIHILKNGIHNLLTRIGSASKVENINDANIIEYLGLLEQKTNEILHAYAASQTDAASSHNRISKATLQLPHLHLASECNERLTSVKPKVYPNVQQEEIYDSDSDIEGDERPYTRSELFMVVAQQNLNNI